MINMICVQSPAREPETILPHSGRRLAGTLALQKPSWPSCLRVRKNRAVPPLPKKIGQPRDRCLDHANGSKTRKTKILLDGERRIQYKRDVTTWRNEGALRSVSALRSTSAIKNKLFPHTKPRRGNGMGCHEKTFVSFVPLCEIELGCGLRPRWLFMRKRRRHL